MDQREKTCCFTGHRNIPVGEYQNIKRRLRETIKALAERGVIYYGAGGALGFDTLAAQAVLTLQTELPQLRLILVLPCLSQTQGWMEKDRQIYEEIKAHAAKVRYVSERYTPGCMHKRNRHLVEYSGVCVCYMSRATGGTAYTVNYAKQQGLEIINLAQ